MLRKTPMLLELLAGALFALVLITIALALPADVP
jgi:hypothetical protein